MSYDSDVWNAITKKVLHAKPEFERIVSLTIESLRQFRSFSLQVRRIYVATMGAGKTVDGVEDEYLLRMKNVFERHEDEILAAADADLGLAFYFLCHMEPRFQRHIPATMDDVGFLARLFLSPTVRREMFEPYRDEIEEDLLKATAAAHTTWRRIAVRWAKRWRVGALWARCVVGTLYELLVDPIVRMSRQR